MNSDRSIDELLEVFGVSNLSNLGSDIIIKYFDDISVREVMKLCRVNKQFNIVCKKEGMWKRKVKNDYGIETKYEKTWKETAQLLFETNMINLGHIWINGKTYQELFNEGLESKSNDYFKDLYRKYDLIKIVFPAYVTDIKTAKEFLENDDDSSIQSYYGADMPGLIKLFNSLNKDILKNVDKLQKQITTMTREFSVVAHSVSEIRGSNSDYNFGLASMASEQISFEQGQDVSHQFDSHTPINQAEITRRLTKFIDPNLYIMTYSFMSLYNLAEINVWDN
uniref:F-box domain-containing protein n=1 Tax=Pithovirus LCPAC401 TaxID=2506595 RepID=A0A481ZDQ3_9VIRU|nr:MAG: uncharacterized protein LCPAC401_04390 [Pithovirus LCPAC401]